jgi:hypothetical protein
MQNCESHWKSLVTEATDSDRQTWSSSCIAKRHSQYRKEERFLFFNTPHFQIQTESTVLEYILTVVIASWEKRLQNEKNESRTTAVPSLLSLWAAWPSTGHYVANPKRSVLLIWALFLARKQSILWACPLLPSNNRFMRCSRTERIATLSDQYHTASASAAIVCENVYEEEAQEAEQNLKWPAGRKDKIAMMLDVQSSREPNREMIPRARLYSTNNCAVSAWSCLAKRRRQSFSIFPT